MFLSLFKLSDQLIFSPRYQLKLDRRLFQFSFQNNVQIDYQNKPRRSIVKMLQLKLLLPGVQ